MPELPEVETIRRTLAPLLIGRRVEGVTVRSPHCLAGPAAPAAGPAEGPAAWAEFLKGRTFAGLERRGKYLIARLDRGLLVVHLRMTGRLVYYGDGAPEPDRHTHVIISLEGGGELRFWDQRKFGRLYLYPDGGAAEGDAAGSAGMVRLGPEPLADGFTPERLAAALAGRRARIKALLLDQRVVAGLGNIYADEALFLAGVHPDREAGSLSAEEVRRLWEAIRAVLAAAIAHRGTTFSDYRDGLGAAGEFAPLLNVYRREGQPCRRCGATIVRLRGGRSTRLCPGCQA